MSSQKIARTSYREPPPSALLRAGTTAHIESLVDQEQYLLALEQVHGSGMHGWGIGDGFRVTATQNAMGVKVLRGTAIDVDGRHISLAVGGKAETNPSANAPNAVPALVDCLADPNGVSLPTQPGAAGTFYVTVRFWETFDWDAYNTSYQQVYQTLHTPWLRFAPTAGFVDDGHELVLAQVTLNAAGQVTGLSETLRRSTALPAQRLQIRRGTTSAPAPNFAVENVASGEIGARAAGGLLMTVPNPTDQIDVSRTGGSFARMGIAAEQVVVRRNDGKESVVLDSNLGNITIGTAGIEGDLLVRDSSNRLVITLDGNAALAVIGAAGNAGDVDVRDNGGQTAVKLTGATGTTSTKRLTSPTNVVDVDAGFFRIHGLDLCLDGRSGGNKRALVDLNNRLVVNFANDYANGVDVNLLHLSNHVQAYFWETRGEWNPGNYAFHTFFEMDTNLKWSEFFFTTMCEVGMFDHGTVDHFWWQTANESYVNAAGNYVVKWTIEYGDNGNDWLPWHRAVSWLAFRR
jgi:hypothetical protein